MASIIANLLDDRQSKGHWKPPLIPYSNHKFPTQFEMEQMTEMGLLALMQKSKHSTKSSYRKNTSNEATMENHCIYRMSECKKEKYQVGDVQEMGIDDSAASSVTSFFLSQYMAWITLCYLSYPNPTKK